MKHTKYNNSDEYVEFGLKLTLNKNDKIYQMITIFQDITQNVKNVKEILYMNSN